MSAPRRRLRDSSWFAFGATTAALVILASGGTALLVQSGAEEGRPSQGASPIAPVEQGQAPGPSNVTVDRVVGTFRPVESAPEFAQNRDSVTLPELLTPPADLKPVVPKPEAPDNPDVVLVPGAPPLPLGPGPEPEQPPLPAPLPEPGSLLPLPLPIPLPLPLPIPDLPLLDLPPLEKPGS
jgi:hypothetical protein